jgi:hypothetical protein
MAWVGFPPNPAQAGVSILLSITVSSYRELLLSTKNGSDGNQSSKNEHCDH